MFRASNDHNIYSFRFSFSLISFKSIVSAAKDSGLIRQIIFNAEPTFYLCSVFRQPLPLPGNALNCRWPTADVHCALQNGRGVGQREKTPNVYELYRLVARWAAHAKIDSCGLLPSYKIFGLIVRSPLLLSIYFYSHQDTCTLVFDSMSQNAYIINETYGVALTIRDYPKTIITLDGKDTKTPSDSLSSVPLQVGCHSSDLITTAFEIRESEVLLR